MNTDFSELSIMQLSDSFFPSGLYTMSNGLETAYNEKRITTVDEIQEFVSTIITQQNGPADCVALLNAYDFANDGDVNGIIKCDNALHSMKLVKESRDASCRTGSQMIKCVMAFSDNQTLKQFFGMITENKSPATHAVVSGVCSYVLGVKRNSAAYMMIYGTCVSIVGAALRLGMIDHIQSQKILHNLKPIITQTVELYKSQTLHDMWQFSPEYDIIQMTHEQKFSKMFIT
jgi:urease accessory protein